MNAITSNAVVQLNVVVIFIKAGKDVVKSKFAAERGISTRTLGRWIKKYEVEARQMIEAEKAPKTSKNAASSKRDLAAKLYTEHCVVTSRKDLIALIVSEAGLTAAGASTYISNFKTGKWDI